MKQCEKTYILASIEEMTVNYQKAVKNNDMEKKLFCGGYIAGLADLCKVLGIKIK